MKYYRILFFDKTEKKNYTKDFMFEYSANKFYKKIKTNNNYGDIEYYRINQKLVDGKWKRKLKK